MRAKFTGEAIARTIITHPASDCAVVSLEGDLDLHSAPLLKRAVASESKRGIRRFVFLLDRLRFFDCSAISTLLAIQGRMSDRALLGLVCSRSAFTRILAITRADRILPVARTVGGALRLLEQRSTAHTAATCAAG